MNTIFLNPNPARSSGTQPEEFTGPVKIRPDITEIPVTPTLIYSYGPLGAIEISGYPISTILLSGYFRVVYADGWLYVDRYDNTNQGFDANLIAIEAVINDTVLWNGLTFTLLDVSEISEYFFYVYPYIADTILNITLERASLSITGTFDGSAENITEADIDVSLGLKIALRYSDSEQSWTVSDDLSIYDNVPVLNQFTAFGYTFQITENDAPAEPDTFECWIYRNNPLPTEVYSDGIQIVKEVNGQDVVIFKIDGDGNIINPNQHNCKILVSHSMSMLSSGELIIGKSYMIQSLNGNDDFNNIGYVTTGSIFIATGTTPTNWTNATVVIDIEASVPTSIILGNNTLGELTWEYRGIGDYKGTFANVSLDIEKTLINPFGFTYICSPGEDAQGYRCIVQDGSLTLQTYNTTDGSVSLEDEVLYFAPIEISVYN